MRFPFLKCILPVILIIAGLHATAQTGSLGDPIYTFDFGSGAANPGPALGTNYTNMQYTTGCPNDGQYSIINSLNNSNNCHTETWQNLLTDHTGNPNGYMMIINASLTPSVFFTAPLPTNITLCQDTYYRFSVYVCNLIKSSVNPPLINPNITFTVTAPDGTILKTVSSGDVVPNDPSSSPWQYKYIDFNTMGYNTVTVTMTNNADGGGGNDLVLDDVSFSAYGPTVGTPTAAIGSGPSSICQGDKYTYHYSTFITPGVYADPAEIWQVNINGAGWTDIPGIKGQKLDLNYTFNPATTPGTYQYRQGVAENANINSPNCRVYSAPVTITVNPLPEITGVEATQTACGGDVLTLSASGTASSYIWTGPNMDPTTANPLIIPNVTPGNSGVYTVTAISPSNCQTTMSTTVTVFPKAHASITGATTICEGEHTLIGASGGISYSWSPGKTLSDSTSANPIATPTDTTVYHVTVIDANGCQDTARVQVKVIKKAVVDAGPKKVIFEGQSIKIYANAQYAASVYWTPTTGLSDPTTLRPIASPKNNITYTLHGVSAGGCGEDSSKVFIRVYKEITIPNTFSPNGDGKNDLWNIHALVTYDNCDLTVFNRYGQVVYKISGTYTPWDGTYKGKPVPAGTYYYILDLNNNTPKLSGYVMVIR